MLNYFEEVKHIRAERQIGLDLDHYTWAHTWLQCVSVKKAGLEFAISDKIHCIARIGGLSDQVIAKDQSWWRLTRDCEKAGGARLIFVRCKGDIPCGVANLKFRDGSTLNLALKLRIHVLDIQRFYDELSDLLQENRTGSRKSGEIDRFLSNQQLSKRIREILGKILEDEVISKGIQDDIAQMNNSELENRIMDLLNERRSSLSLSKLGIVVESVEIVRRG